MGEYLEKKLLAGVGLVLSLLGGTLLLMAAGALAIAVAAPFLGEFKQGLAAAGAAVPIFLAAAGCLYVGLWMRLQPLTLKNLARNAGESTAFMVTGFWTMRVSAARVSAWETLAYLLLLCLIFIAGLHKFMKTETGARLTGKPWPPEPPV